MKKIPDGWEVVRLGETVKEIRNGFASGKRDENGIVQIRMNNVTTDGHLIFDSYLKVPIPKNIDEWLLKEGDVLFNNTNSIDLVGKSTVFKSAPFSCTFSNHFTRIRFKKEIILPELILYHFIILWEKGYFKSVAIRHVGQSAVHNQYLINLKIPLPPLPEQKKIAEILGTVDETIEKVGQKIEKTERLKKGLMQKLLTEGIGHKEFKDTEIGKLPKEWQVVRLGEYKGIQLIMGQSPPSISYNRNKEGIPFLQGKAEFGTVYPEVTTYTTQPLKIAEKDDILISVRAPVGDVNISPFRLCIGRGLAAIRVKQGNNFFYFYWFHDNKNKIENIGKGSTFKAITKDELENFSIPLPPLPEQKKIAEILSAVDEELELEKRRKEKLEKVKRGLMEELLTGKKRVKV